MLRLIEDGVRVERRYRLVIRFPPAIRLYGVITTHSPSQLHTAYLLKVVSFSDQCISGLQPLLLSLVASLGAYQALQLLVLRGALMLALPVIVTATSSYANFSAHSAVSLTGLCGEKSIHCTGRTFDVDYFLSHLHSPCLAAWAARSARSSS